ncbi:hypothetical protein KKE99_03710, partial [Patescibacteria group bacterium]|nr:hypothetical protein [Patescibacteria group bacterium]
MRLNFKILILALVLAVGFHFQADILKLHSSAFQKIFEIEKASIPNFDKFKENIAAIIDSESQVFAPPPLKTSVESPVSLLTLKGAIAETNIQRKENGLSILKENAKLNEAARA